MCKAERLIVSSGGGAQAQEGIGASPTPSEQPRQVDCLRIFTVRHGCELLIGSKSSIWPRRQLSWSAEPFAKTSKSSRNVLKAPKRH